MRGATTCRRLPRRPSAISIHAPHARSDVVDPAILLYLIQFQSTLLMRGATFARDVISANSVISIHAPHARSDTSTPTISRASSHFNPRSSCEERLPRAADSSVTIDFNPRSSCEERPDVLLFTNHRDIFQSTLLMRGATGHTAILSSVNKFQSTLLMRGATAGTGAKQPGQHDFNPRSSCEERLRTGLMPPATNQFQSTLLMRGATAAFGIFAADE